MARQRGGPQPVPDLTPQFGDDLAAAAAAGLDSGDPVVDNVHGQTTIQPAWRAKFLGATMDAMDDDQPKIGEVRQFVVTGVAVKQLHELRKDGEQRETWSFDVTDVVPAPDGLQ